MRSAPSARTRSRDPVPLLRLERARRPGPPRTAPSGFRACTRATGGTTTPTCYGCLYLSEQPLSCVVEQLARFRGQRLLPALLVRRGLPRRARRARALRRRPISSTSTTRRCCGASGSARRESRRGRATMTQPQARSLCTSGIRDAAGLRWWSTFEAQWLNVTLFDRAGIRAAARLGSSARGRRRRDRRGGRPPRPTRRLSRRGAGSTAV